MLWRNEPGYLAALQHVYTNGANKTDRTGTGTRSLFGQINLEFDLYQNGHNIVPKLSTKLIRDEKVRGEYDWMMSGSTRLEPLIEQDIQIWNNWVLKGTEVLGDKPLSVAQRMKILTKEERAAFEAKTGSPHMLEMRDGVIHHLLDSLGVRRFNLLGGELGQVYGKQWRDWEDTRLITSQDYEANREWYWKRGFKAIDSTFSSDKVVIHRRIDQIKEIEESLSTSPDSRRMILNAWNVACIDEMALPPCHTLVQWGVEPCRSTGEGVLSCKLYQRSGDMFLGVPWNFLFYSMMTHMLAAVHGFRPGVLYHSFGDAHIYNNHFEQVLEQLSRQPSADNFPHIILPTSIDDKPITSITQFRASQIEIHGCESQGFIGAPVAT